MAASDDETDIDTPKFCVDVLLPLALAGAYTYLVPDRLPVRAGSYVRVPLGPRERIGVAWSDPYLLEEVEKPERLREIVHVYDAPPLGELNRTFFDWVAQYTLSPPGAVLRMALRSPDALDGPRTKTGYRATGSEPERMTPQRARVLEVAGEGPAWTAAQLAEAAGVSAAVVKSLADAGGLEKVELPVFAPFKIPDPAAANVTLNPAQQTAAEALRKSIATRDFSVTLIDGVTGSGKTEVYFEAMAATIAAGQQVLLLLPEIALTGQFIERVEARFGAAPAEWHSGMRARERERVWRGVASGDARIVVGARSALFLPWANPGLIVVDEEHEPAFKQDDGVMYHARDMAVVFGALGKFPILLASATPSLESLVNVDRERYEAVQLPDRHGRAELPEIELVDLRTEQPPAGQWLSETLHNAVTQTLEAGSQALLFLNRRGYAPLTLCRACGHRFECPNCQAWLVEHRFRRQLMCHHCGHAQPSPPECPACGTQDALVACGPGVERLAEEAVAKFPEAKVAILSSDLMGGAAGLRETLRDITQGHYNLIIGTQLVAKGHHFPELTLAGIVDADIGLGNGDPRAGERTWQLLSQVAGRSGRGEKPGRAIIQSHMPDHPIMSALQRGDREGFLAHEKRARELAGMPPFGRLAGVIISGPDVHETQRFARNLSARIPMGEDVRVLGPAPAPLAMIRGRHRFRFLVKTGRDVNIQAFLNAWLAGVKPRGSIRMAIDVDAYNFM